MENTFNVGTYDSCTPPVQMAVVRAAILYYKTLIETKEEVKVLMNRGASPLLWQGIL